MQPLPPDYIIAIGASAGGIEEINNFFDNTPLDGAAYVVVQHLSSDSKSRMAELVSKHSKLAVIVLHHHIQKKSIIKIKPKKPIFRL